MKLDRDCITTAGAAMRSSSAERAWSGRKPWKETENSPDAPQQEKADAGPGDLSDDGGRGSPNHPISSPKMNTGSRMMLRMAPEPWTIMKPAGGGRWFGAGAR